jgi:hypothetical protein
MIAVDTTPEDETFSQRQGEVLDAVLRCWSRAATG